MRRTLRAAALCLGMSLLGTAGAWADTLINFDNVTDGTVINNLYSGVTFSCFSSLTPSACPSANVYARSSPGFAFSGNNVVSTEPTGILPDQQDPASGAIEVQFATAQSAVSIEAMPLLLPEGFGTPGIAYLQAYDSSLHLLGEVDSTTVGSYNLLSLAFAGDISYLLIGETQGNFPTVALFDDLCYSSSATGCSVGGGGGTPPVPEPTTVGLLGAGLAGVLAFARRKVKLQGQV